ncbi:polyketide antibiotic transporter [Nocardia sp. NPDC050793]|uniref:polyketide antibiotic transporter n=1 Tax=Nocardia sp. NPDC050793 TaxID=3155159 RepID=UPI0033CFCEFD
MTTTADRALAGQATAPRRALAWLTARQVLRGTILVALTAAGMSAIVAGQYEAAFADALDTGALRALAENPSIRVLFGTPLALDDPGGFTVWRTGTPISVLGAVWALLAATRITRGEEDAGRWDLLLAGRVRMVDLVAQCILTLVAAAAVIGMAVGIALIVTGTDAAGALVHGIGVFGSALVFATVGLLAAQLLPFRAAAAGVTGGVVGMCLLLRMLADGVTELSWIAWITPFGLTARAAPYAGNRYQPLLVLVGGGVLLAIATLAAARTRDLGGAMIVPAATRPPRRRLLGSLSAFAVRRARSTTTAWAVGVGAYFLLIGALISAIIEFLDKNARFADLAATAGFAGLNSATGFAAAMFSLLTIPAGLFAVTRLETMAADEKARHWTALYALPISRNRLLGNEIAVTATAVALLLVTAAVAMWTGAALTGAPLSIGAALAGALNAAPIAWLALGAAAVALGWYPPAVGAIGALPVVGGFLLNVVDHSVPVPSWLATLSPFAHLAAVPHTPPDWTASGALTATAIALTALGLLGYQRRDLDT